MSGIPRRLMPRPSATIFSANMTATGLLIDGTADTDLETFLTDGSAQIAAAELSDIDITFSQSGGPNVTRRLGENLILMINDPTSKPLQIPVGTMSGLTLAIPNIAPGEWTLTLAKEDGTVLGSRNHYRQSTRRRWWTTKTLILISATRSKNSEKSVFNWQC